MEIKALLKKLDKELLLLLKTLNDKEWSRKLSFKNITVKDAVINLLQEKIYAPPENNKLTGSEVIKRFDKQIDLDQKGLNSLDKEQLQIEYLKRWEKHQHIFYALNSQKLLGAKYYRPYLNILLKGLPAKYKYVEAGEGDVLKVEIVGEAGNVWNIKKENNRWMFCEDGAYKALIYIDQQIAWLLFAGLIDSLEASQYYQIHGDRALASMIF
ncbi:hypothetical protein I5M32_00730 [Pedobacter sp. SD-b]|uniref:Uncharacterized protein n=1 Tax=Pedobacter segetis TaxID=2793069 RepID=A0ABS1BF24_9SPHI|nr:hypothetical protein [Pedobacter segetis]MBK0381469.1 hypothetical protein [Pedobacter segetis]